MDPLTAPLPVVVVGAGPTGASAAILLGQLGVSVLVLDRWADVYPQPRAVHLDDEVFRVLHRMGVADGFAAVSRPGRGLRLLDRRHRVLAEFGRDGVSPADGFPRANVFDQPDLERLLRDRMASLPSVTFRGGVEVLGVDVVAPGRARVRVRAASGGAEESIDARVVLGCDGANSVVRATVGTTMRDLRFDQRWLVVDVDTPAELGQWEGVHQVCDSRAAATYMRIGERRHRWELRLRDDEDPTDLGSVEALLPRIRPWTGDVPASALSLVRATEYTFRAQVADRWRRGPVFLLGDAAHLTPPFIGQGLGAGVRDAANLAWKLHGVLSGHLPADVLDTYETERREHATALVRLARITGLAMTAGGRPADALRRVVVPAVPLLPAVRRAVSDSVSPPLGPSSLARTGRGDALAGTLCPMVEADGRVVDAVGAGRWALVTGRPPSPLDRGRLVDVGVEVVDAPAGSALARWLARSDAALVRPDGTVLTSGRVAAVVATATGLLAPVPEPERTP